MGRMPVTASYRPAPLWPSLNPGFADPVEPVDFPKTILRWRNDRAAAEIGLDALSDEEWIGHFGRFAPLPGNLSQPLAQRYHGHQFRVYNPQIGDGRGFTFAQCRRAADGQIMDLGTKGSGRTPYSRTGDGRLTLKGGVREILAAEMNEALGVPTSRAFSLIETGEQLHRGDEPSPTRSAVLVRYQPTHIRFGTFQRHAAHDDPAMIERILDYVAAHHLPILQGLDGPARAAAFLRESALRTAALTAAWMAAGFVHGVLNTDNFTITGESFDYGPWRFLPAYEPGFTAAYFDETGLYCYARQTEAAFWALEQLAGALSVVCEEKLLIEALAAAADRYRFEVTGRFLARLGLAPRSHDEDSLLLRAWLGFLRDSQAPWEQAFFDWFGGEASAARAERSPERARYQGEAFEHWRALAAAYEPERPERLAHAAFAAERPPSMEIEEVERIWAAIDEHDDWAPLYAKIGAVRAYGAALDLKER